MFFDPTPEILVRAKASSAEEDAALDRIATKLLKAKGVNDDDIPARLATLEVELKEFRNRTGPFDANSKIWHSSLLAEGRLAEWHATSLLKTTKVFGSSARARRASSRGSARRSATWGEYKRINSKFRSLKPETAEKKTVHEETSDEEDAEGEKKGEDDEDDEEESEESD